MGRKKEKNKGGSEEEVKKSSSPSGCGGRAHLASEWGGEKSLKNTVIHSGFLEAFLTALDAEDAGFRGLAAFRKLETMHSTGSRLVEHGKELANGKRQGSAHYRSTEDWEEGPAGWMVKARSLFADKIASGRPDARKLLIDIGEKFHRWSSAAPGRDVSLSYRRMSAVARKLNELCVPGASVMASLENEAIEGKLPWLFQSMDAADKKQQAEEASRKRAEAEAAAARKAAEAKANAGK